MSLAGDDAEHVIVVPGGLLAPAAKAGLTAAVAGDRVEGDSAQEGEVAGGGAVAHPAVILTEGDVENPMQGVLDAPVPADCPDQDGGIVAAAGEEVADLGLDLAGAVDAADRLHRRHGAEIGPAAQRLELPDGGAHEDAPADQAAVALVGGGEHRPTTGPAAEASALERLAHSLEGMAVTGLQHQEVVGGLRPDPRGDVLLAAHGVERHDGAVEMQGVEKFGNGGDLVRLAIDLALAEHQSLITGPGADQMERAVIVAAAARAPHGLAVDRHHVALDLARQGPRPPREAGLERVRVDQHEDPPERVVRGDAVRQGQEGLQPGLLAAAVELDVLPAFRAGITRTSYDPGDFHPPTIATPAWPRIR